MYLLISKSLAVYTATTNLLQTCTETTVQYFMWRVPLLGAPPLIEVSCDSVLNIVMRMKYTTEKCSIST